MVLLTMIPICQAEDIVEGYWKSFDKKNISGYWIVFEQDNLLFATCVLAVNQPVDTTCHKCTKKYTGHPMMSADFAKRLRAKTPLVFNLRKVSDGVWEDGHIIDARNGRMYTCNISYQKADGKKFKVDSLAVRGEIGFGIGMTIYWEKATVAEINAAITETAKELGGTYALNHLDEFLLSE